MTGLFRKEAMAQQQDRLHGDVLLLQPLSIKILCAVILLLVSAVVVYLSQRDRFRSELESLITEQEDQQDQLQAELSSLVQQIAELHGRRAYVISAPGRTCIPGQGKD